MAILKVKFKKSLTQLIDNRSYELSGFCPEQPRPPPLPHSKDQAKPEGFLHCRTRERLHSAIRFFQKGTRKIWKAIRIWPFCEPPWPEVRFDPFP
jgi:hypothetical protein